MRKNMVEFNKIIAHMVATKITIPKGLNEFIDYINNSFIQSNELYDDIRFDYAIGNTEL
jgi:hypothetical protein